MKRCAIQNAMRDLEGAGMKENDPLSANDQRTWLKRAQLHDDTIESMPCLKRQTLWRIARVY